MLRTSIECIAGPSRPLARSLIPRSCTQPIRPQSRGLATTASASSGHNRWSKIRHKKGAVDAQRSAIFSRLTNEIHQSMKPPLSPDPNANPRLAAALQKAKEGGVPKSGVENALARARAAADGSGVGMMYEAVAAGGKAALIIECMTDNPTRTVSRVKELLNKYGGRMAPTSYLFERKGQLSLEATPTNPTPTFEALFDTTLNADLNIEDIRPTNTDVSDIVEFELLTPLSDLQDIAASFNSPPLNEDWVVKGSDMVYEPVDGVDIDHEEGIREDKAEGLFKLIDALEIEQDITQVWTNLAR